MTPARKPQVQAKDLVHNFSGPNIGLGAVNPHETSQTHSYLTNGDKGVDSNGIKISWQTGRAGLLGKQSFPGPQTLFDTMIDSQTLQVCAFRVTCHFPRRMDVSPKQPLVPWE